MGGRKVERVEGRGGEVMNFRMDVSLDRIAQNGSWIFSYLTFRHFMSTRWLRGH